MMGLGSGCEDGGSQKMAGGRHATSMPSGLARGSATRHPAREQSPAVLPARAGLPVLPESAR